MRESEQRLIAAQHLANLGDWWWDVHTGEVNWSDEVYKTLQLDPEAFTPRIDSILPLSPWPEDHQRDQEPIQRSIESRETGSDEQRFLRPDGSTGFYASTFQGVYDDHGRLVAMKGTVQDITGERGSRRAAGRRAKVRAVEGVQPCCRSRPRAPWGWMRNTATGSPSTGRGVSGCLPRSNPSGPPRRTRKPSDRSPPRVGSWMRRSRWRSGKDPQTCGRSTRSERCPHPKPEWS